MASNTRDLLIRLLGDSSGLKKALADADGAVGKHDLSLKNLAGTIGSTYAAKQVLDFGKASVDAAVADEAAQVKLATALRNTVGATDAQIASAEDWITKQMFATGITDDELRPALARLVRSTGDVGQAQSLLSVAMDASVGTGKDLQTVTEALAKASDGNTGALGRLGIATKDASGATLSFDQIVQNLSSSFSGQAAAAADTQAGRMAIMKAHFGELQEQIGQALLPIMEQLTKVISGVTEWFSSLDKGTQTWIVRIGLLGGGLVLMTRAVNGVLGPLRQFGIIGEAASKAADATTASTSKLAGASAALGPAAAAAAAGLAAWEGLGAVAASAMNAAKEAATDLSTVADDQLNATFLKIIGSTVAVARNSDDLDDTLRTLVETNREGAVRFLRSGEAAKYGSEMVMLLRNAIAEYDTEQAQANETAAEFGDTTDDASGSVAGHATGLALAAYRQKDYWSAVVDSYTATYKQSEAEQAAVDPVEHHRTAVQNLRDTLAGLKALEDQRREDALGQIDAQLAVQDGMVALNTALGEYNKTTEHSYDSTKNLRDQAIGLAEDFAASKGAADGSRESVDLQIWSLAGLANTLEPGSPLRVALEQYIKALQGIPGQINTAVMINGRSIPVTSGGDFDVHYNPGPLNARVAGGPVSPFGTYVVGERGREVLQLGSQGGSIIPNNELAPIGAASVIENHYHAHFNGPVMADRDWTQRMWMNFLDGKRRGELVGSLG